MNHPTGFRIGGRARWSTSSRSGRCSATRTSGTSWCTCTWRPSSSPASSTAGVYAVAGCADAATATCGWRWRCRLVVAAIAAPAQLLVGDWAARDGRREPADQAGRVRGPGPNEKGAPLHIGGWYDEERGEVRYGMGVPRLLSLLAFHDPNATVTGLDSVPADDRPPGERGALCVPHDGRDRHLDGARSALVRLVVWWRRRRAARGGAGSTAAGRRAGPLSVVALIAGWVTTEVGRQPWVVYDVHAHRGRRDRRRAASRSATPRWSWSTSALAVATVVDAAAIGARAARHGGRGRWGSLTLAAAAGAVGLAAYVVLGGADFGAGFWDMLLAGERGGRCETTAHARDGPGVGGQPRLADLRSGRRCGPRYPEAFGSIVSTL